MSIRVMVVGAMAGLALAVVSSALDAQSMPALTRAKAAASHAVAATNAHTQAMQNDAVTPPKPAPRSAEPAKAPGAANRAAAPASRAAAGSKGARGPGAGGRAVAEGGATSSVAERGEKGEVSLVRESFTYDVDGRRDPFMSLLRSGDLRPMISDLKLVTIIYDPTGRSVAILRDLTTKEQYRVRVGQTLGRMRVSQIHPKTVTFTLEELGFSRQEVLALNDTTSARSQ